MLENGLIDGLGALAMALAIAKFQMRSRHGVLFVNAVGGLCVSTFLALQGHISGSVMAGTTAITSLVAGQVGPKLPLWARLMVAVMAVAGIMTLDAAALNTFGQWLPILGFTLGRLSETLLDQLRMRQAMLLANTTWLSYGLYTLSPQMILLEIVTLASNLIGIRRVGRRRLDQRQTG